MVHVRARPVILGARGRRGPGARGPGARADGAGAERPAHRLARHRSGWRLARPGARGWRSGDVRMNAVEQSGGVDMFQLPERMDSATAAGIEKDLLAALHPQAKLIVDGSAVTYMSAAGVRALATVLHGAQEQAAQVVFCRFSGSAA